ncbi:dTDP-4-dehydrorhamnose 3,5-epimerase [Flavobacterium sp.]|uniref:dTDP-4-dehydrorhamnose 3,5-epimerase n=1 Tax=Flavobacterium sp. TaxID=239 RepID=UPI00262768C5|nr:dTDP-4-dehydrorhamnose 3,5-epimerase [Flavobacterium sp.]MDG2433729.1 dTDP-4-dehydrorhamnose 3,5-epimerase [Flavobacterium sp.]
MKFVKTPIENLFVVESAIYIDERGYFFEAYNREQFLKNGFAFDFIQDNQSFSTQGVIRGLHFQIEPYAQTKLVRVLEGEILDVVVDLRHDSKTYGHTFSVVLSVENKKQLLVPAGFAHGFSVLSETASVMYKVDQVYNKESERGIRYDDPTLNIDWKIAPDKIIVSDKDLVLPYFTAVV